MRFAQNRKDRLRDASSPWSRDHPNCRSTASIRLSLVFTEHGTVPDLLLIYTVRRDAVGHEELLQSAVGVMEQVAKEAV